MPAAGIPSSLHVRRGKASIHPHCRLRPQARTTPNRELAMRKLKLESLHVESFETTAPLSAPRGTVQGHDAVSEGGESICICQVSDGWECQTWDYQVCGDTNYLDCTFVCSYYESCPATC
jgi:hypothetical protein